MSSQSGFIVNGGIVVPVANIDKVGIKKAGITLTADQMTALGFSFASEVSEIKVTDANGGLTIQGATTVNTGNSIKISAISTITPSAAGTAPLVFNSALVSGATTAIVDVNKTIISIQNNSNNVAVFNSDGTTATCFLGIGTVAPASPIHLTKAINDTDITSSLNTFLNLYNTHAAAGQTVKIAFKTENGIANSMSTLSTIDMTGGHADFVFAPSTSGSPVERMRLRGETGVLSLTGADPKLVLGAETPKTWFTASYDVGVVQSGLFTFAAKNNAAASGWGMLGLNTYFNVSGDFARQLEDEAACYFMINGTHNFYVAASGLADTTITWTTGMFIGSTGKVGIGTDAPVSVFDIGSPYPVATWEGAASTPGLGLRRTDAYVGQVIWTQSDTLAPDLHLVRFRDNAGAIEAVQTGDSLGGINWNGYTGTTVRTAGGIYLTATGTVADATLPSYMTFHTNKAGTVYEAMRIDNNQILKTNAGRIVKTTPVNAATYDLTTDDHILHVTYTGTAAVTSLTLMTAQCVDGRTVIIKDAGFNAGANNITVDTEGAENIDGNPDYTMSTNGESITLYAYSGHWYII